MAYQNNNNNDMNNMKIVPDMPVMRSVKIGSMTRPTIPLMRSSYLEPSPKAAVTTYQPSKISIQQKSSASPWTVSSIQQLSVFYPLERYHAIIEGVKGQEVADRIQNIAP